jgi:hypothetical protein
LENYSLCSPFDITKHKQTFDNYLEVLILPDGEVVYAVPSHSAKAEKLCCDKLHITQHQLQKRCPREYYYDYLTWLLNICGAIAVWTNHFMSGECGLTNRQKLTLKRLKLHGVFKGAI